jgi:hypothetical protein
MERPADVSLRAFEVKSSCDFEEVRVDLHDGPEY